MKNGKRPFDPQDYVLIFREAGKELGRLGVSSEDNVYYSWNLPMESCMIGSLERAGSPEAKIPLDPLGLQSILGVCALPRNAGIDSLRCPARTQPKNLTPRCYAT